MKGNKIIVLLALFTSLVTYQLWKVTWEDLFMWGMTVKDVLIMATICRFAQQANDYWMKKIGYVFLCFNFIDMLDEMFGTPLHCGINEYLTAALCAIIVFKEELFLDRIVRFLIKWLDMVYKRFCVPLRNIVQPILFKIIKPVQHVFKRRDGRT